MKNLLCFAVFLVALCAAMNFAHAVLPDEKLSDAGLESRAREISRNLRCVVCQNESIDESTAPIARAMRRVVREKLLAGEQDQAVIDYMVARYGEFVLLKPAASPANGVLWLAPFLMLGFAAFLVFKRKR